MQYLLYETSQQTINFYKDLDYAFTRGKKRRNVVLKYTL